MEEQTKKENSTRVGIPALLVILRMRFYQVLNLIQIYFPSYLSSFYWKRKIELNTHDHTNSKPDTGGITNTYNKAVSYTIRRQVRIGTLQLQCIVYRITSHDNDKRENQTESIVLLILCRLRVRYGNALRLHPAPTAPPIKAPPSQGRG